MARAFSGKLAGSRCRNPSVPAKSTRRSSIQGHGPPPCEMNNVGSFMRAIVIHLHRTAISVKRALAIPRGLRNREEWAMLSKAGRFALVGFAATISACASLAYAGGDD